VGALTVAVITPDVETVTREGPDPVPREPDPRSLKTKRPTGDRVFHAIALAAGLVVLVIMGAVGLFLTIEALDALSVVGFGFLTTSEWEVDRGRFGVSAVMLGTALIAVVAVAVAMPIAMGTALFITDIAPPRLRSWLVSLVDLMAAVPSVVYGLWGLFFFQGAAIGLSRWISTWFGWIPIFAVNGADPSNPIPNASLYTSSAFIAGIVVALMVMPIQCSVMREVFSQVPIGEREGAFALGATRWGMIRIVSMPFARGGIIGGTMLGLGRALGETIAVVLIISPQFNLDFRILEAGANSVASLIALRYSEASARALSALFAAGLALFIITLIVNFTASWFVSKSRSGAASEA
jgi:phosphate transport system permease protein